MLKPTEAWEKLKNLIYLEKNAKVSSFWKIISVLVIFLLLLILLKNYTYIKTLKPS